jgi:hypothetical protein
VEYNIPAAPVAKAVVVTPAPAATQTAQTPTATPVTPQQQPTAPGQFNLNGKGENSIVIGGKPNGSGGTTPIYNINFTFDISKISDYLKGLTDFNSLYENGGLTKEFLNILNDNKVITFFDVEGSTNGISELLKAVPDKAEGIALNKVFEAVAPQVVAEMIPVQPAIADEAPVVEPEVIVSNVEGVEEVITPEEVTTEVPKRISLRDRTKLNPNINRSEMRVAQVVDQIKQFKPEI